MYKCESCGAIFEEPADRKEQVGYEPYDVETFGVCPECGSEDFYEVVQCEECGDWFSPEETLTEYFCKECEEKLVQNEISNSKFTGLIGLCDELEVTQSVEINAFFAHVFTKEDIENALHELFFEMPQSYRELAVESYVENDRGQFLDDLHEIREKRKKEETHFGLALSDSTTCSF